MPMKCRKKTKINSRGKVFHASLTKNQHYIFSSFRTFKMADVTISEVRLKTLMKEIFKEEFEKQQKNLLNLISGNFVIPMTEIKKVQSYINELKARS